ncbi:type II toxin-antitoxin system antitoxin SocA domain-containing protein [Lacticaseibacillus paracasei]|uniref:type II toxin-antitoxin system antitoxin SocA domain-containing protein n=1 Tax=Lacticaseibacillus paracasei TaxID=1597 RepID=UPI003593500D
MSKQYEIRNYTNTFLIRGTEYEVTAPAKFDRDTGELIDDKKLDDAAVELANDMYRQDMGIVSPEEIKKFRARVKLSQREFASLMGWSPTTVALYETGAFPSEANNKILRALINDDNFLSSFIKQNKQNLPERVLTKAGSYLSDHQHADNRYMKHNTKFNALQLTNWFRVNNFFSSKSDPNTEELSQMKVVKLLYFAFGRWLAQTGGKLFTSDIIAMPYGPVVEEVHQKFSGKRGIVPPNLEKEAFDDYNLIESDDEVADLLNQVVDDFGGYSASGMVKLTHQKGSPWAITGSGVIKPLLIEETFKHRQEM